VGGIAAILAGILFRRNLGVEITLLSGLKQPVNITDWFMLLQTHRWLGLAFLNIFDLVNVALVGLLFLALYIIFRQRDKSLATIAAGSGFMGIVVYLSSNTAFSLLSLSNQFAQAESDMPRARLLAAGQALLSLNRFNNASADPGSGGYISLLLVAFAGLLLSIAMIRSNLFRKPVACIGILANGLDLAYCLTYPLVSLPGVGLLAILFIPAAGLLLMVWHILVGWRLLQLGNFALQAYLRP
jgi:hypothetical protein